MDNPGDLSILKELVVRAEKDTAGRLTQFLSLAGAYQYKLLYQLFHQYISPGAEVLDWGAGNGHFSYFLCRSDYKVTAFGFENYNLESWLGTPSYRFIKGNTSEPTLLPFEDQSFEAAASVGVLEHVYEFGGNEEASLKEIVRVLKPQGLFICYHLPNKGSWIEFTAKFLKGKFTHQQRYNEGEIRKLFQQSGLNLLKVKKYGFLPRNSLGRLPKFLRRSLSFAKFWNSLDNLLSFLFSLWCQNYYVLARKIS